ncbi:MAG: HEAT repeat domain-containing protein [Planctomycetes bacterium]|nr:HEAT repeat domain-containing protein [Planctomycetota bacterium]
MSLSVLTQVYEEVRRLAIAGSVVAPGDFRLRKLLPQLEQTGTKAPVLAKLSEVVKQLIESTEATSAAALLELTALVHAVLYTQGETGLDGELVPIKTFELAGLKTQTPASVLKPLQDALTKKGSGRFDVICEAHAEMAFHDLRLIRPALAALDDNYSEIADFVALQILPLYGDAILPELRAAFDPKGRAGHVRRLLLMHRLDPAGTRACVQRALEEGSKEMRIAAIDCLGDSPDDLPFLLEQVKAKTKDVRAAALRALGRGDADDAVKALCDSIRGGDLALAVTPIRASRNRAVWDALLAAAERESAALIDGAEGDKRKLGKQNERMCLLLECLRGRGDEKTESFLRSLCERVDTLAAVGGEPSGKDVAEKLVSVVGAGPPSLQSAPGDARETPRRKWLR